MCEYCGEIFKKKESIIGHHLLGRKFQERFNLEEVEYCRVRHTWCEYEAHKKYPNGNLPHEQEIFDRIRSE